MSLSRIGVLMLLVFSLAIGLTTTAAASPNSDMSTANEIVDKALSLARQGDLTATAASYEAFSQQWRAIEDGIKARSVTAYRSIEEGMSSVRFALLQNPVDPAKVTSALQALSEANQRFVTGGYPADGVSSRRQAASLPCSHSWTQRRCGSRRMTWSVQLRL